MKALLLLQDYEEPLMFCLNEVDEEDDPSQSDSGKDFIFKVFLNFPSERGSFLRSLLLDMVLILEFAVPQLQIMF